MAGSAAVLNDYLIVGALLFTLGLVGFLARRNLIVMLQGVSLTLVAFSAFHGTWGGQVFAIFSLALAAAEAGIALALFVVLFRRGGTLDVSVWQDLREADQPRIVDESAADEKPPEPSWPHLPPAGRLPDPVATGDGRPRHGAPGREPAGTVSAGKSG